MWTKIVIKDIGNHIGYTDNQQIVVHSDLTHEERNVVVIHEKSHILLQHLRRGRKYDPALFNSYLWNVACDLEIAKHIYTAQMERVITGVRSNIAGGITSKEVDHFPECEFAEDFYYELLKRTQSQSQSTSQSKVKLTEAEKQAIQEKLQELVIANNLQVYERVLRTNRKLTPSLAGELDAKFSYGKRVRNRTYNRPSRRVCENFLFKGYKFKVKVPKLLVYVDCSGSFTPQKTAHALKVLDTVLKRYRGSVTCDVRYFSEVLLNDSTASEAGMGTNYEPVLEDISSLRPEVAIIITDSDQSNVSSVIPKDTKVIVIPVGCTNTWISTVIPHAVECNV